MKLRWYQTKKLGYTGIKGEDEPVYHYSRPVLQMLISVSRSYEGLEWVDIPLVVEEINKQEEEK